jgi:hypothetical protein
MIHGHECVDADVQAHFKRKVFIVFGASIYCGHSTNKAAS